MRSGSQVLVHITILPVAACLSSASVTSSTWSVLNTASTIALQVRAMSVMDAALPPSSTNRRFLASSTSTPTTVKPAGMSRRASASPIKPMPTSPTVRSLIFTSPILDFFRLPLLGNDLRPQRNSLNQLESAAQIEPLRSGWIVGVDLERESRRPTACKEGYCRSHERFAEAPASMRVGDAQILQECRRPAQRN